MNNYIFIIMLIIFSCSSNERPELDSINKLNKFIDIDFIELSSNDDTINFQLQIKIPTNKFIFTKHLNGFNSKVSIDAIFMTDDKIILNESWTEEFFVDYFEDTKIKNDIVIVKNLNLPLGSYYLNLIINDYKNHTSWHKKTNIELDQNFNMSDILFYKKQEKRLLVIQDKDVENLDTLWVQYQFNNLSDFSSYMDISYDFFYIENIVKEKSIELDNIYADEDIVYKNKSRLFVDRNGINYYPIKIIDDFFNGLVVKTNYNDNYRYRVVLLDRYKKIEYDFEKIVGPMEYILENSNFRVYREYIQLNIEEKIDFIKSYWDLNDTDDEFSNELFKEFYNRVEYSNKNFGYLTKDGWYTDRGKIYIIYGQPLEVKEEFTTEGKYEIWIYKNNKQFIFHNRYGPYILINTN